MRRTTGVASTHSITARASRDTRERQGSLAHAIVDGRTKDDCIRKGDDTVHQRCCWWRALELYSRCSQVCCPNFARGDLTLVQTKLLHARVRPSSSAEQLPLPSPASSPQQNGPWTVYSCPHFHSAFALSAHARTHTNAHAPTHKPPTVRFHTGMPCGYQARLLLRKPRARWTFFAHQRFQTRLQRYRKRVAR